MKIYDISRLPNMILLGFDGENNWRPQSFDVSPLLQNHPNGTITLWLLPDGETQAYPVALERDGNTVVWTPLSEEMTARTGALQIVCTDGTDVGKSRVALFRVDSSILPGADHPAAVPSWATQTIERAEDAADRAEAAADSIDLDAIEAMIAQAIEDYLIEHPIEAPVQSVNGKTGAVVLDASDVGALPANTPIPPAITVDSALSGTSENPVQNKVITAALALKAALTDIPQMATQTNMSDWTQGKTVDAAVLKDIFYAAVLEVDNLQVNKADKRELVPLQTKAITDTGGYFSTDTVDGALQEIGAELGDKADKVAVTASDDGKFLRVVSGAWAAQTVPAAESNSFGGGS